MIKVLEYKKTIRYKTITNNIFKLLKDEETSFLFNNKEYNLLIKKGFEWDGATIPRFLWSIIGFYPAGILLVPSLWHDYVYYNKGFVNGVFISRNMSDLLFYEHLIISGVKVSTAKRIYKAIRIFGMIYWIDNVFTRKKNKIGFDYNIKKDII